MEHNRRAMKTSAILLVCMLASLLLIAAGIFFALQSNANFETLREATVAEAALDEANAALSRSISAEIAILIALAVLAAAIYFINIYAIVKPTKSMQAHFARIAQGDLHTKCPLREDNTEIGRLVASANFMQATYSRYINIIESVLAELAAGNLSVKTDQDFAGDFIRIKDALERITASYGGSFAEINGAADEMVSGAEQISIGASSLSEGSSEQAATIEELTSAMSGVSQRVSQTVGSAEKVRAAAINMVAIIRKGNESLTHLAGAIEATGAYSTDISNIIKVIDNIAFQTNILALNAAVEAARAGENGAAFGVVADEVRALSNQTAQNAKVIAKMIEDMLRTLEDGVHAAKNTEGALGAIIDSADNVQELVGHITEAMESDAAAVEESLAGLEQLSAVVQGNSATAEESAAASEEIAAQALAVKELVGKFKR